MIENSPSQPSSDQTTTGLLNNSPQTTIVQSSSSQVADTKLFINYLRQLISVLLECSIESSNELEKCLNEKSTIECVKKFISESQVRSLVIHKFITKDDEESEQGSDPFKDTDTGTSSTIQYVITIEMHYTSPKCLTLQIIKRGTIVESDKKFSNQLRVISLFDSSPYETLHSYVSNTLAPYFKSYIKRPSSDLLKQDDTGSNLPGDLSSGATGAGSSAISINGIFVYLFIYFYQL